MSYNTEYIASTLRFAREARGLSQRELSAKSGVPQGHISKIENGAVDLRVSSLVALARTLDLEPMLVPSKSVPAVQSIASSVPASAPQDGKAARRVLRELARLQNAINNLPTDLFPKSELEWFQRHVRGLSYFRPTLLEVRTIRDANQAIKAFGHSTHDPNAIRQSLLRLRDLRNALAHGRIAGDEPESVRPAYSLDEDDHG